jgi:hypothetical protein
MLKHIILEIFFYNYSVLQKEFLFEMEKNIVPVPSTIKVDHILASEDKRKAQS